MSTMKEGRKTKKVEPPPCISWQEKKDFADKETLSLEKDIQDLSTWTDMIDVMNDEQLKEYLKNRPYELKTLKIQKSKPKRKVQHVKKAKPSSSSVGIMASVWKFHKEDDEEECSTAKSTN